VGTHQTTAHYHGSADCLPSDSAPVTVTINEHATTTTLTVSPATAHPGEPVALTAHVTCTAGTPTGNVDFLADGTSIGTADVDAQGDATFTTTGLAVGTHQITTHYRGGPGCPPSVSEPVTVTIEQAPVASLALEKRVQTPGPFKVGDKVDYSYAVTNTGNTELRDVVVRDDRVTTVTCTSTMLEAGHSTTCHGSFTITRADTQKCHPAKKAFDQGGGGRKVCSITNTAIAAGIEPTGRQVVSEPARATITVTVKKKRRHCKQHPHDGHRHRYGVMDDCDQGAYRGVINLSNLPWSQGAMR
jgi:hypothetical protein